MRVRSPSSDAAGVEGVAGAAVPGVRGIGGGAPPMRVRSSSFESSSPGIAKALALAACIARAIRDPAVGG
jgi:hypothetical protein